jgi:chemotaxis protein CheY-P-specific phosphatase CheC
LAQTGRKAEAGDLEKAHAQLVKARDEAVAALAEGKGIDGQAELLLKFQSAIDVLDALMAEEEEAEDEDEDD